MQTALRSIRIARLSWTALAVVPFALAACGGDKADARPVAGVTSVTTSTPNRTQPTPPHKSVVIPAANVETPVTAPTGVDVSMPATYENADAVYKSGHYPEAAEMFERYVETKPNNSFGFYMLGLSSWKAGDFDRAHEAFKKSIDIDPAFAKSYFNDARVLLDLKRSPEALAQIEQGLSIDSTSADGWRLKARAQAAGGNFDGAMQTYRDLLVRNDEDLWGLNNLGVLLLDSGDYEGALGPLARSVQLKPTAPIFQNNFGMALERSGYMVAALHHYQEAVRDDSGYTKAVKNAERLSAIVTDSTLQDEVTVQELAETFRQKVEMWKQTVTPAPQVKVQVKPDSVKPDSVSGTKPDSVPAMKPDTQGVKKDTMVVPPTVGDPIKAGGGN
jgi:tetratricopeptide (TPR) repeat protein